MRSLRSLFLLTIVVALAAGRAAGDDPANSAPAARDATPDAYGLGIPIVVSSLTPERWGALAVQLKNPLNEPVELTTATHFGGYSNLQYGRKFWLPPHSRRSSWQLIKTPPAPEEGSVWKINTLVEKTVDGRAVVIPTNTGEMALQSQIRYLQSRFSTGLLGEENVIDKDGYDPAYEALIAMRFEAGQERRIAHIHQETLPAVAETLDSLDQLAISGNAIAENPAAIRAVRQWVQRGGKLWLLLDRIDVATVDRLFGDAVDIELVDRVALTEIEVEDFTALVQDDARSYEEPVDLVRVLVSDVEVACKVNGWPAAFWKKIGRGEVLFTTLAPHGWIRARIPTDRRPTSDFDDTKFVPLATLERLGDRFMHPARGPALAPQEFEPFLVEQIGYKIVSRKFIAGVLGGFCALLAGAGLLLARIKRPQHMAPLAAVLAVAAAAFIAQAAVRGRQAAPATVGLAQFVEAPPGAANIELVGMAALYHRDASSPALGSQQGGMLLPDMTELGGTARRLVWDDLDRWRWDNLNLPAGIRQATLYNSRDLTHTVEVRAALGPQGLSGSLSAGPFENISDPIIATSSPSCLAVHLDEDGAFQTGPRDLLLPGQYTAGAFVSDEQRRRQAVLATLLAGPRFEKYVQQPTLLFWADPLDLGFDLPADSRRIGAALIAAPIVLERTPPQTRVVVPTTLATYQAVTGPHSRQVSSAYGNKTGEWLADVRFPTEIWLQFDVPDQVRPLRIEQATLSVRIAAPGRTLEVFGRDPDGELILLRTIDSPADLTRVQIDRPELLPMTKDDGFQLGLIVGDDTTLQPEDIARGVKPKPWTIESVDMLIEGVTE